VPRLLPILALPLLVDLVAIATGKLLSAATGGPLRSLRQRIDGPADRDGSQLYQLDANKS
jgi:hypothetical protein